jgi:hypothetical protein
MRCKERRCPLRPNGVLAHKKNRIVLTKGICVIIFD